MDLVLVSLFAELEEGDKSPFALGPKHSLEGRGRAKLLI
jgi:hypothetical protein